MRWLQYGLLLLAPILLAVPAFAQEQGEARKPRPLFASDDILRLTIAAPVERLARDRTSTDVTVPGQISVVGAAPETLAIELSPRGLTRRKRETCSFPPIMIRMAQTPPRASLFRGQKSLKLVTHCRTTPQFQQLVMLEYAAYRIFNLLSSESFRARLALIDYVDDQGRPITTRYGFLIEDVDDVARRHGKQAVKAPGPIAVSRLDPVQSARVALFQDLIGNHDWAVNAGPPGTNCCHNSRAIAVKGATNGLAPMPYDFDYAGLVDAPYAAPPEQLKLNSVRERRYRGFCRHNDVAIAEAARLVSMRDEVMRVLEGITPLEANARRKAATYLDSGFQRLQDPQALARRMEDTCIARGQ